ncbi:hypothetical protein AAES_65728 [Amazona aestiva]|uniref:Uncharacterized protein n=1 Tax=Amazona aestiva TaxID=12930 RepID=A0A0Q3ML54_AMAAE|nr:hypothetical protein AAES_65728 [Amazona aestiva]
MEQRYPELAPFQYGSGGVKPNAGLSSHLEQISPLGTQGHVSGTIFSLRLDLVKLKMKRALGSPGRRKMTADPTGNFSIQDYGLQAFDVAAYTDKAYYSSTVLMIRNEGDILWSPLNYTPVLELTRPGLQRADHGRN